MGNAIMQISSGKLLQESMHKDGKGRIIRPTVRIFYKPSVRIEHHHVNVLNNYSKQLYLICLAQSPLYVVSIPKNGGYSITIVHLDYFHITTLIARLLTTLIVQCH